MKLEAKVKINSLSIGRGLVDEAALLDANYLLIGGPSNQSQRLDVKSFVYVFIVDCRFYINSSRCCLKKI